MRIRVLLTAMVLVLVSACSGVAAPEPELLDTDTPVPLSYMLRGSQETAAIAIAECWANMVQWPPGEVSRGSWLKTNQEFTFTGANGTAYHLTVKFTFAGFDPAQSTWNYGPTRVLNNELDPLPGETFLFNNRGRAVPLTVSLTEKVTYEQSRSTETSHETSIDIQIGSKTTGTIGGEATGAKLEQEFSASLGLGTKDAETKAEGESKSKESEQQVGTEVEPDSATLAKILSPNITSLTPFTIDGVWDGGMSISFNSAALNVSYGAIDLTHSKRAKESPWKGGSYGIPTTLWTITWTSWDDFVETVTGVNTDFPRINVPICPPLTEKLNDPATRRLQWSGTQHRSYQSSAEYTYTDVADNQDTDDLIKQFGIESDHIINGG